MFGRFWNFVEVNIETCVYVIMYECEDAAAKGVPPIPLHPGVAIAI